MRLDVISRAGGGEKKPSVHLPSYHVLVFPRRVAEVIKLASFSEVGQMAGWVGYMILVFLGCKCNYCHRVKQTPSSSALFSPKQADFSMERVLQQPQ